MILQALYDYYERKAAEPGSAIPPYGYGEKKISFCLILTKDGRLLQTVDLRIDQGKRSIPRRLVAPMLPFKKSAGIAPNFTWDNTGYALGVDGKGKPERTRRTFEAFRSLHRDVANDSDDEGLRALVSFLENWTPEQFSSIQQAEEILDTNLVFRLEGDGCFLYERPEIEKAWQAQYSRLADLIPGYCLVTGQATTVCSLHPEVSGVAGAQSSGALLVSFNEPAYESYGKSQSINAPVGERASFCYTTALNFLLRKGSRQRIQLGDATTVFWAERSTPAENLLAALFDPPELETKGEGASLREDPTTTALVREVLRSAKAGKPLGSDDPSLDPDVRFFVLGLSPNNARLAVRFWNVSTFGQLVERVGRHFRDMDIERQYDSDPDYPPLSRLILEMAPANKTSRGVERDRKRIPPLLAGAMTRSLLTGSPYPRTLFTGILGRIRADRIVNYLRAALLKACLVRNHAKEVPMSLDCERNDPAYRLGRLFALLEKAQKDATNPTTTIRDRYFGAASATPAAVFPQLLRLGQHHISKAEYGGHTDKLIAGVVDGIDQLPKHLSLEDQGLFTLGYYHQRNALFRKSEKE